MKRAKSPDDYYDGLTQWREELNALRVILKSTDLSEEIKWGGPCYTLDGRNVVGVGGFKSYFGLWFHQGALLNDEQKVLINAQEGKTRALRQWRMTSAKEIKPALIKRYIKEAMALAKEGKAIAPARGKKLVIPAAFSKALGADKAANAAFKKLTPGKQREYADYVAEAKQDATKLRRVDKILPMIRAGKGLNDKYR